MHGNGVVHPSLKGFKMTTLTLPAQTKSEPIPAVISKKPDKVEMWLDYSCWIEGDEIDPTTGKLMLIELVANKPSLDPVTGAPMVDRKSLLPITERQKYMIERKFAMKLYQLRKAEFVDMEAAFKD
jgi:hypothetical protein